MESFPKLCNRCCWKGKHYRRYRLFVFICISSFLCFLQIPEINSHFPLSAQFNERGLFKLPSVAPQKFTVDGEYGKINPDSLIVTETAFLRFARDYGLMPFVCSQQQIRDFFKSTNRAKCIVSSRLPTRSELTHQIKPHSNAQLEKQTRKEK
jgi:hypothetical protein